MTTHGPRILVVDDEPGVRAVIQRILTDAGFTVTMAARGREGLQLAQTLLPDLMILDLNLPDISGAEICKKVRADPELQAIAVMILTGHTAAGLPANCLEGGADDYVSKPFEMREFVARVRALLRRPRLYAASGDLLTKGAVSIRLSERKVTVDGAATSAMAPKEFDLLYQLLLHAPQVVSKEVLSNKVWGIPFDALNPRTLDVHIRRIRQKLGSAAECLKTVPAVGFQWVDKVAAR